MPGPVPVDDDRFHDRCGLFGIFGHPEAAHLTYLGLYALQHRGQESAGIVCSDGERLRLEKGMGLVNDVFTEERLASLTGDRAMGHVRYSTAGDTVATNAQPYLIECHRGPIALGHNGNLVNATILRHELEAAGSIFLSTSDTEVILHLYARSHRERLEDAIAASLTKVMGAFSVLFLTKDALVAARDPWGFRPLVIGQLHGAPIICSGDVRARPHRREVRPRRGAGRARDRGADGPPLLPALPAGAAQPVHLRARLLRPAGQPRLRPERAGVAARPRAPARARGPRPRGHRCPRPGQRHGRGPRLRAGERAALPVGPHPQPLRGPDVHRAPPVHPRRSA